MANSTIIKQHEIHKTSTFSTSKFEIRQNGSIILTTHKTTRMFRMPQIDVLAPNNTILASVKLENFSRNCILHLGNPDGSDKSAWTVLDSKGFTSSSYKFPFNGHTFAWTRTHDSALGASRLGGRDFKLVDEGTGQVLAVFRYNYSIVKHGIVATIEYYVELGQELELMSLAAVLGVEERIAKNHQASAAGGAGAGA